MHLSVDVETGRRAFSESAEAFVRAVDGLDEHDLLGTSRCHGWTRLDVVVHVIGGWQEMLGGLVSTVDRPPTVDAASYWTAFEEQYGDEDPVATLMAQRRRSVSFTRPGSACDQLRDLSAVVLRGVAGVADRCYLWDTHVFKAGDYLAVWAVEDSIHHLDLLSDEPVPDAALNLCRATVEALAGTFPESWTAEEVALVGTGRLPVPEGLGALADRLPALG